MTYPKNIDENLRLRVKIVEEATKDLKYASDVKHLFYSDILFAFNMFFWAYDPRVSYKNRPIITYSIQDKAILEINHCIETGEDLFIDKSRDMLATYMVLLTLLWRWITKRSEQFRIGSRKEELVYKTGDMGTHFEKLRLNLSTLPWFLRPVGFDIDKHLSYMRLLNPENDSAIIGEATNKDFARGDRKTAVFMDEFQNWEDAEAAWKSASDVTRCKIALGTPEGSGNKFAELARTDTVKHKLHLMWYYHPEKAFTSKRYLGRMKNGGKVLKDQKSARKIEFTDWEKSLSGEGVFVGTDGRLHSEWYDKEVLRRGGPSSDDVKENLDCDYLTTGRPVFDTLVCQQRQMESKDPLEIGDLIWKTEPIFNDRGECVNRQNLKVEFVKNINGLYKIWEHPKTGLGNGYVIAADVAEGLDQGDFDDATVLSRLGKVHVVCSLHGHIRLHEYAWELAKVGVYYGNAFINVERNNNGHGVIMELVRIYNKLWHKDIFTKGYAETTDQIGFQTTAMSKPSIIGQLGKAISENQYDDPDVYFWTETMTFVNDHGKMEAQGKSHGERCYDDRIMSRAIALHTHLNMPLPYRLEEKPKIPKWRQERLNQRQNNLVGWVVA